MRVLIVEDDRSVGAAIQLILGREGCKAMHAPDGGFGIKAFESSSFDLAIIDIFLPDISGLETIAEFRRLAPRIPILAMSGFRFRASLGPVPDYLALALQAGAAACLRKPFAPQQLMTAVQTTLASVLPVLES